MKPGVKKWFMDAKKWTYKRDGGCVIWDTRFDRDLRKTEAVQYGVDKYQLFDTSLYIKDSLPGLAHTSLVNSEVMSQAGFMTPPPIILSKKECSQKRIKIATQDVASLDGLECVSAAKLYGWALFESPEIKSEDKWAVLRDKKVRDFFLQYMTPTCLEQLVNAFIATELLANPDMHLGNYLLIKKPGSKLYEGICPIDLEQSEILFMDQDNRSKGDVEKLLNQPYKSMTPTNTQDKLSYTQRMQEIRKLVEEGLLTKSNKDTIRAVLSCNVPQIAKNINKAYKKIKNKRAVDVSAKIMHCAQNILEPVL